nr:MAG TPA: terminase [Caudoviricetes sp.]DAS94371.1 MAG TPA: terminase [Caudoviricetes sp.]DAW30863.1 MAG TPA: terminase [Caudoviricetes sp.]
MESKEELKRRIGRSPDSADAIMMRMVFTIEKAD